MSRSDPGIDGLHLIEARLAASVQQSSSLQHALNVRADIRHALGTDLSRVHDLQMKEEAAFIAGARREAVTAVPDVLIEATRVLSDSMATNRAFHARLSGDPQLNTLVADIERLDRSKQKSVRSIAAAERAGLPADSSDRNELRDIDFQLRALLQRNGATMPVPLGKSESARPSQPPIPLASKPGAR